MKKQSFFNGQTGSGTLPAVIGAALVIGLIQVPLYYKINSGNKFSGKQRVDLTAKSAAESGVEQVITDLGKKTLRVDLNTDTTPYVDQIVGDGKFTTHIKGYNITPDRVEVTSTGEYQGKLQKINARLELEKIVSEIPFATNGFTLWGINDATRILTRYSLSDRAAGVAWVHPDGQVDPGLVLGTYVDDFTVAINGNMYFINNTPDSELYKIRTVDLDNDPTTDVPARLIGTTGLLAGTDDQIRGMIFVNGVLYVATWKSKKIYELSIETGLASPICSLIVPDPFEVDAITLAHDKTIYLTRTNGASELWKIDDISTGAASYVTTITGSGNKVRAIAGHPDGYLYAVDGNNWYRINPLNGNVTMLFSHAVELKGMGFHYEREDLNFTGKPLSKKVRICHYPPGNPANMHTLVIGQPAVSAHIGNHPGDTVGYCGLPMPDSGWIKDTVIEVKIISWSESPG